MRQVDYRETHDRIPTAGDSEQWHQQIHHSLSLGLREYHPALISHDGTFVVCGSGPSLPQFTEEIREEQRNGRPICAVKGAHDHLVEHGILPDLYVCVDPQDRTNGIQRKNERTTYLLASRCHPAMFEHLKGHRVVLWHSLSFKTPPGVETMTHEEILALVKPPELRSRFLVGGGTTSGLRAVFLGRTMGFRRFVLYGFDSCLAPDGKTKRFTGEQAGHIEDRIVGGKRFLCNGAMALQAEEFQELYNAIPDATFEVKGDGLIAAIIAERKRLGMHT